MQEALSEVLDVMETVPSSEDVWDIACDYLQGFGISTLVYRTTAPLGSPLSLGHKNKELLYQKSLLQGGERHFDLINFSYQKEFLEPNLELRRLFHWTAGYVLYRIYAREPEAALRFPVDTSLKGIMFPVVARASRKGIFILAYDDARRVHSKVDLLAIQMACRQVHTVLVQLYLREAKRNWQLSSRDMDILKGVVAGKSNVQIAASIGLSKHTVDAYLRRVFLKLGVSDRTSAAVSAINYDLVAPEDYCVGRSMQQAI